MTEADEIAESLIAAAPTSKFHSFDEALAWLKARSPDWKDWVSTQMLDNIAEAIFVRNRA